MDLDRDDVAQRLLARRQIDQATGCWLWPGATLPTGHGQIRIGSHCYLTHRLAAWLWLGLDITNRYIGSRIDRSQVNHKPSCPNANCFNPEHIYVGTQKENRNDVAADKQPRVKMGASCKNGHAVTPENYKKGVGCLICARAKGRASYYRHREKRMAASRAWKARHKTAA